MSIIPPPIAIVGISGTNGKTTVKDLLLEMLSYKYAPSEIKVVELHENTPNEFMNYGITHGIILNTGHEKPDTSLYIWLRDHAGTVFIDEEDRTLVHLQAVSDAGNLSECIRYRNEEVPTNPFLLGGFNKGNMRAAAAIAAYFKIKKSDITKTLKTFEPRDYERTHFITKKENEVIDDSSNANPASMKAMLEAFSELPNDKPKWLVLGDMPNLGDMCDKEHKKVLDLISFYGFTNVILVGEAFFKAHEKLRRYASFKTKQEAASSPFIQSIKRSRVLVKGCEQMNLFDTLSL